MFGLFITGTDTGVGKTYFTSLLARQLIQRGYSVGAYKPVCSGAEPGISEWPDVNALAAAIGHRFPMELICPQRFHAPLAPPVAAALEGKSVNSRQLRSACADWEGRVEILLVEGVGGWMCPLTNNETIADLARDLGFPVLVVSANRLGMISQTLLTLQSIKFSGLPTVGAVVNSVSPEDDGTGTTNMRMLKELTNVPLFGPISWGNESEHSMRCINSVIEYCICKEQLPAAPLN